MTLVRQTLILIPPKSIIQYNSAKQFKDNNKYSTTFHGMI